MTEQEEFEFRHRLEQEQGQTQGQQPPQDTLLNRAADMSQGVQDAVFGPVARAGDRLARGYSNILFGSEKPAEYTGKAVAAVGSGLRKGQEYMVGKMGELGVNPYVAAAIPTVGSIAFQMLAPGGGLETAEAATGLANTARRSASSRWFKGLGGTLSQAKEIGAEEALRIGRAARDKGIITPLNSVESQQGAIAKGLASSGKRIEELRGLGDLYGDSPEAMKIVQVIEQDLRGKYGSGIRAGEAGDLNKAIQEVLKLEPVDKMQPTEELAPRMQAGTIEHGVPSRQADPFGAMQHKEFPPKESYEQFRAFQEDPNYVPEYDLHRPTTHKEVAKVATDLNQYAKGQSKLLRPSGAMTDAADSISRLNNESLQKALPKEKGAEYAANLKDYSDLSTMDRINELKGAYEVGGSRNSLINNIANRIYQKFGLQLSAGALDQISSLLPGVSKAVNSGSAAASKALISQFVTQYMGKKQGANNGH